MLWISENGFSPEQSVGALPTAGQGSSAGQGAVQSAGQQAYYKARISIDKLKFVNVPSSVTLVPGMTLTADIKVGRHSLARYILGGISATPAMRCASPDSVAWSRQSSPRCRALGMAAGRAGARPQGPGARQPPARPERMDGGERGGKRGKRLQDRASLLESRGVLFSAIEAKRWLEAAARGGHRQAQFELGRLLLGGGAEGQAERWAARARERGETDSEDASLKAMFPHGVRFESDPAEAVRLLTEAANSGHPEANALMAVLSIEGRGCEKDFAAAKRFADSGGSRRPRRWRFPSRRYLLPRAGRGA